MIADHLLLALHVHGALPFLRLSGALLLLRLHCARPLLGGLLTLPLLRLHFGGPLLAQLLLPDLLLLRGPRTACLLCLFRTTLLFLPAGLLGACTLLRWLLLPGLLLARALRGTARRLRRAFDGPHHRQAARLRVAAWRFSGGTDHRSARHGRCRLARMRETCRRQFAAPCWRLIAPVDRYLDRVNGVLERRFGRTGTVRGWLGGAGHARCARRLAATRRLGRTRRGGD
ncbi:MAG: hypothetical protein ACREPJ_07175, partial [Rhodanobacteraceae bacterium]